MPGTERIRSGRRERRRKMENVACDDEEDSSGCRVGGFNGELKGNNLNGGRKRMARKISA